MPLALRVVRQPRWYQQPALIWLERGDVPADPLADLNTTENKLSIYKIEDDKSNLIRVISAYAANRNYNKLDYILFDWNTFEKTNIRLEKTPGNTPDEFVNDFHYSLIDLSGLQMISLTKTILSSVIENERVDQRDVLEMVRQGIVNKQIIFDRMNSSFKEKLSGLTD